MIIKTRGGKFPIYKDLPIGLYLFICGSVLFVAWQLVRFVNGAIGSGLF